jgi:hypothetical protein
MHSTFTIFLLHLMTPTQDSTGLSASGKIVLGVGGVQKAGSVLCSCDFVFCAGEVTSSIFQDIARRTLSAVSEAKDRSSVLKDWQVKGTYDALVAVSSSLFVDLENEPQLSPDCPFDPSSPEDVKISGACCLEERLRSYTSKDVDSALRTPEIRLEGEDDSNQASDGQASTLLASTPGRVIPANPGHASALLRLLYIHRTLHPDSNSPYTASLLVTLYSALNQEIELADLAHVEADTFWLFETLCTTVSELEDEERGISWMKKISSRLVSVDGVLFERLVSKLENERRTTRSLRLLATTGIGPGFTALLIVSIVT